MEEQNSKEKGWRELTRDKGGFQSIVALLVDFDERTGRVEREKRQTDHLIRRSICQAPVDRLRIFINNRDGFIYPVLIFLETGSSTVVARWVLEDGIRMEREELKGVPDHPVHRVLCVPDLYDLAIPVFSGMVPDLPSEIQERILGISDGPRILDQ